MITFRCYIAALDWEIAAVYDCTQSCAKSVETWLLTDLCAHRSDAGEARKMIASGAFNDMRCSSSKHQRTSWIAITRCTSEGEFLYLLSEAMDDACKAAAYDAQMGRHIVAQELRRAFFITGEKQVRNALRKIQSLF